MHARIQRRVGTPPPPPPPPGKSQKCRISNNGFLPGEKPINYFALGLMGSYVEPQRGSCMVWEINMGVCPRLDFENIMLFNCLGYNFNIYGAFEFLCNSIANL